ncbi:SRPBCC family protein [Paenibacillus rigui]|uniref:Cell division protein n=1 Tax=Paenibacillus rigui TaxID=554312 RepID=A0A229UPC0_9BACL|nr:SRPBCC family protein [Paenibacillus rigui]OXM85326.1 cell division protein [Paenibacillus rigui]
MPLIRTEFIIQAPVDRCFDLARSIDIHAASASQTRERAIAGRTTGLIELGETVTWEAVHFGIRQRLTARIAELERPYYFVDEMVHGAFKRFRHTHEFVAVAEGTHMIDTFDYESPFGLLGRIADALFLEKYMKRFLIRRNEYIKKMAEHGILQENPSSGEGS